MNKTALFFVLCCVVLSSATVLDLHPEALEVTAEELNKPEINDEVLADLAYPALRSGDEEAQSIVENFLQEGLETDQDKFSYLGNQWSKLKKTITKAKALVKKDKKDPDVFAKHARHGLTPLEFKYMRLYRRYKRLQASYKRGCVRTRFWLRLHKWHWRVLMAAHKKLRNMVSKYAKLLRKRNNLRKALKGKFRWASNRPLFESARFLKKVIGLAKSGANKAAAKAIQSEKNNTQTKKQAIQVAKQLPNKKDL